MVISRTKCCPSFEWRQAAVERALATRRYVPFYASQLHYDLEGHIYNWVDVWPTRAEGACKSNWTLDAQLALVAEFWADAPTLLPLLGKKPHWMQLAEIEWMLHRCSNRWGITLACHPLAEHMIFATPEALTETHATEWHRRYAGPHRPINNNSVVVPYLGHIHPGSVRGPAQPAGKAAMGSEKDFLATMTFGSLRKAPLRMSLMEQCTASPGECWYMRYSGFKGVLETLHRSWFCVQPHGDSPMRSALTDCIASGLAIPCVFDEYMFDMMAFSDVLDYRKLMVYVPMDDVMLPGASVIGYLREHSNEARGAMLASLQEVAHVMQYAVQPNHYLVRWDSLSTVDALDDAFTMSVKAVLRHACRQGQCRCPASQAAHGMGRGPATSEGSGRPCDI